MPELITIYWRDIPSQVTAKAGRKTAKVMLPDRFQHAIDRAAMRAGKGSSDAYMEDWRRDRTRCSSELQSVAEDQAAALIAQFNDRYLEALVKAKGVADQVAPDIRPGPEPAAEDSDDHVDSTKPDDAVGVERPG